MQAWRTEDFSLKLLKVFKNFKNLVYIYYTNVILQCYIYIYIYIYICAVIGPSQVQMNIIYLFFVTYTIIQTRV